MLGDIGQTWWMPPVSVWGSGASVYRWSHLTGKSWLLKPILNILAKSHRMHYHLLNLRTLLVLFQ